MNEIRESSTLVNMGLGGVIGGAVGVPTLYLIKAAKLRARIYKLKSESNDCQDPDCLLKTRIKIRLAEEELEELARDPLSNIEHFLTGAVTGALGTGVSSLINKKPSNVSNIDIKESVRSDYTNRVRTAMTEGGEELNLGYSPGTVNMGMGVIGGAIGLGDAAFQYMRKRRALMRQMAMCDTDDCKAVIRNQLNALSAQSATTATIAGTAGAAAGYGLGATGAVQAGMNTYRAGGTGADILSSAASKLPGISTIANNNFKAGVIGAQQNPNLAKAITKNEQDNLKLREIQKQKAEENQGGGE